MPHGTADYGADQAVEILYKTFDMAELAVRLGALSVFHRGGNVLWWDGFEASSLHWNQATSGTGAAVALDTARAHFGSQSCKLTTGSTSGKYADISRRFPLAWTQKWGYEVAFSPDANIEELQFSVITHNGTRRRDFLAIIDIKNSKIYIYHAAGATEDIITSIDFETQAHTWYHFKVIVDLENNTWWRLLFNDQDEDLSSYADWNVSASTDRYIQLLLLATTSAAANQSLWLDDVIVTINDL